MGWTVVLNPDGTTTAWNPGKTKILRSHSPHPTPGNTPGRSRGTQSLQAPTTASFAYRGCVETGLSLPSGVTKRYLNISGSSAAAIAFNGAA